MPDVTLTPVTATALFVVACLAGMRYRNIWKAEGPRSRLWLYGVIAAVALLVLGRERGLEIAERKGIAALFIDRGADGFVTTASKRFATATA